MCLCVHRCECWCVCRCVCAGVCVCVHRACVCVCVLNTSTGDPGACTPRAYSTAPARPPFPVRCPFRDLALAQPLWPSHSGSHMLARTWCSHDVPCLTIHLNTALHTTTTSHTLRSVMTPRLCACCAAARSTLGASSWTWCCLGRGSGPHKATCSDCSPTASLWRTPKGRSWVSCKGCAVRRHSPGNCVSC